MRKTRASCVVRRAWLALVLIGCSERPQPSDDSAPPTRQPAPADESAAAASPTVAYQPDDAAAPYKEEDGDGYYVPRTRIDLGTLDRDSIVAFSVFQRGVIVKADYTGQQQVTHCGERIVTQDTLHLLCVDPILGTITIDGHFLVPRVENGILLKTADKDVVDAMVAVTRNGKVRYAQRHLFGWVLGE